MITRGDVIGRADLPISIQEPEAEESSSKTDLSVVVERLERRLIRESLARSGGVQTRAAEQLGITERTLHYKLKKYGFQGEEAG